MEYRRQEIRAGIFLFFSFVVLAVMVFAVSDIQSLFRQKKEVRALFAFSDGIEKNAPVRFSGMKIGKVENVRVAPEYRDAIEVTMSVYSDTVIKNDTRAAIKTLGLVGGKYVELSGGSPDAPLLGPRETLHGEEALKLEDITKAALDVVARLQNIATNLDRTLGDPQLTKSLRITVANLQEVTENVKVMTSSKDEVARGLKSLPEMLQRIDGLVRKLDETSTNLKAVTEKSDKIIGDNKKNIDDMMKSFRDMADNLKQTTDDVKSHPWKLIRKP